jgi:hypothetical protein
MAFKNSFFSVAGQKERISNVGKVLGIATGIYNPTKTTIQANTSSKTANKVIEAVSNHPYASAGIVAAGVTAAKLAPSIVASASTKAPSVIGSSFSTGTKLAVAGAAGLAAGSLLSGKGGNSEPTQITNPFQAPKLDVYPVQKTDFNPSVMPTQNDTSSQSGTGNIWNQTKTQDTYSENYNYQNPIQETTPYFSASQDTNPELVSTGGSSGTDWLTIGLIGAGLYFLVKD